MTDETTARDRAEALPYAHKMSTEEAVRYLREEIAPQANREMLAGAARAVVADYDLRALAGAPTADVAHTCRPEGDPARLRTGTLWTCPVDGAQWVSVNRMIGRQMRGEWRPRPPLPSTPPPPPPPPAGSERYREGAPTADVADEAQRLRTEVSLLRMEVSALRSGGISSQAQSRRCWHDACIRTITHSVHETDMGERWHERKPAAPEGETAADERFPRVAGRCPSCRGASLFLGAGGHVTCSRLDCPAPGCVDDQLHAAVEDEPDGMDLESQGEMGDQLAAAQAAIQRVREKHVSSLEGRWCATCRGPYPCPTVRALDGDADEEKR